MPAPKSNTPNGVIGAPLSTACVDREADSRHAASAAGGRQGEIILVFMGALWSEGEGLREPRVMTPSVAALAVVVTGVLSCTAA